MPVDFRTAVLARSHEIPVVVDFWAPWCGPCRVLGPVLDELAADAAGRWELVKVDVDEQPDPAQEHGVRGIPAVKLFHEGRVRAEFVGALPAGEVRRWLDEHLPDPRRDRLEKIAAAWPERGSAAAAELEAVAREHPESARARLLLARSIVASEPDRARELVRGAAGDPASDELASHVLALADLAEEPSHDSSPVAASVEAARAALREDDFDRTLEHLVAAVAADRGYRQELARRAAVALFGLLGHDHELTRKHRPLLSRTLHA